MRMYLCLLFCVFYVSAFSQNLQEISNKADSYFNSGNLESALNLYLEIFENQPLLTDNIYKLAITEYERHNYGEAKYYFKYLISRSNNFPLAYFYAGKICTLLQETEQAKQFFHFFQNNYKEQFPNEYQLSRAYMLLCSDMTQYAKITEIDIPQCIACFGSTILGDSIFVTQCRTTDKPYLQSKWTNTLSESKAQLFELLRNLKDDVPDVAFNSNSTKAYFSKCTYRKHPFCKIYMSAYSNSKWSKPKPLELDSLFSSQPCFVNDSTIVFSSNRAGTYGNMDLWIATISNCDSIKTIQNAGAIVNTLGDEVTPYYDSLTSVLYFSSDYFCGYGGFDVFSIPYSNKYFRDKPINLKQPVNSSKNDLYYKPTTTGAVEISNRNFSVIDGDSLYLNKPFGITFPHQMFDCSFILYFSKNQPSDIISDYNNQLALLQNTNSLAKDIVENAVIQRDSLLSCMSDLNKISNLHITISLSGAYSPEGDVHKNIALALRRIACVKKFIKQNLKGSENFKFEETVSSNDSSLDNFDALRNVKIHIFESQ